MMQWILLILITKLFWITQAEKLVEQEIYPPPYPAKPDKIPYHIDPLVLKNLTGKERYYCHDGRKEDNINVSKIEKLLEDFKNHTCLCFKKQITKVNKIGINFYLSTNGTNYVELSRNKKNPTNLFLNGDVYSDIFKLRFFVGVALGLMPEVQRIDRDLELDIYWQNISLEYGVYYEKSTYYYSYLFYTDFDFTSAMMLYYGFGAKEGKQLTYKSTFFPYYELMMKVDYHFTYTDYRKINYIYCNNDCEKYNDCKNGGYYYDGKCDNCTCPELYHGKHCEKIEESTDNCTYKGNLVANSTTQVVLLQGGYEGCYLNITTSKSRKKVQIRIMILSHDERYNERDNIELIEVKYRVDKGVKGLCINTKKLESFSLPALSNEVHVKYEFLNKSGPTFLFLYKEI